MPRELGENIRWFSDKEIEQIREMSGLHMTQDQQAAVLKVSSATMDRRLNDQPGVREAYIEGKAITSALVRKSGLAMALSGNSPAMTIFWLRCKENFQENDGKIEQIIISSLTDEELVKLSEQAIKTLKEKDLAKEKKDSPDA
jgi:hypothetical protein